MLCNSYALLTPLFSPIRPDPNTRVIFQTRTRPGSFKVQSKLSDHQTTLYDVLGLYETTTVSILEIKQAYKQMALKYHPDVSPPGRVEEYTQRFIRVQEAYEMLSDPNRRALYDCDLGKGLCFGFSAPSRRYCSDEEMEEKSEWKSRWQSQVSELKRRSMNKDSHGTTSWGARMRRQNHQTSSS